MKLKVLSFGFVLKTSLALVFLGLLILHVDKLAKKDVGSKSFIDLGAKFPSIAACPYSYHLQVPLVSKGKNLTLSDAMNLPSIKDTIDMNVMYSGLYSYE